MFTSKLSLGIKALLACALVNPAAAIPTSDEFQLDARADSFPSTADIKLNYMRIVNPPAPCVFYNTDPAQISRARLQQIAQGIPGGGVTLYDIYYPDSHPRAPFNNQTYPFNRYLANDQERGWFRVTSRAFAEICRGRAYIIWDRSRPFENANQWWEAIFSTDEFDAVYTGHTGITSVYIVDPTTGQVESSPAWQSGQQPPTDWWKPNRPLKRSVATVTVDIPSPVYGVEMAKRTPKTDGIEQDVLNTVFTPGQSVGWVPGTCSFHFRQAYSGPNGGELPSFDLRLFDNEQTNIIGGINGRTIPYGEPFAMPSRLQYTLVINPGRTPTDPVQFGYAGITFDTSGPRCKVGKYDPDFEYGARQGDCSFPCNQFQ